MGKYPKLLETLSFFTYIKEWPPEVYQEHFLRHLASEYPDDKGHKYLKALQLEVESAITDPDFDWITIGMETGFIDRQWLDSPYNPYQSGATVLVEFKRLTFDMLYPERALSKSDRELLLRIILFLLTENGSNSWVSFQALLVQIQSMRERWKNLSDYQLDDIYLLHALLEFHSNPVDYLKNGVRFKKEKLSDLDRLTTHFRQQTGTFISQAQVPYLKWPPFSSDPEHFQYMKYDGLVWIENMLMYTI